MPFLDPIVAGDQLVIPQVRTPNYLFGVSGWILKSDGTAEFQQITAGIISNVGLADIVTLFGGFIDVKNLAGSHHTTYGRLSIVSDSEADYSINTTDDGGATYGRFTVPGKATGGFPYVTVDGVGAGNNTKVDTQNTSGTFTSAVYTASLTGAGAVACGFSFIAPKSGQVLILNNCHLEHTVSTATVWCSFRVRTGGTVGSGSDVLAVSDSHSVHTDGVNPDRKGSSKVVSGLTPGSTYNVQQLVKTDGGATATVKDKELIMVPQL
jgi:hypothetical protein